MKKFASIIAFISVAIAMTGCSTGNAYLANRNTTIEMYHIFDIKTKADTAKIIKAAGDGLAQNTNEINQVTPLQMGKQVPVTPGRFAIEDIGAKFAGTGMGNMLQMASIQNGGAVMKTANCADAVWSSRAVRSITGSSNLTLYSCLFKYKDGYQLDTYAVFQKTEGGLTQISRDIASSLTGTPEQWVNKTILDTVTSIERATGSKAVHLEGQPELNEQPNGTLVQK